MIHLPRPSGVRYYVCIPYNEDGSGRHAVLNVTESGRQPIYQQPVFTFSYVITDAHQGTAELAPSHLFVQSFFTSPSSGLVNVYLALLWLFYLLYHEMVIKP